MRINVGFGKNTRDIEGRKMRADQVYPARYESKY
nr:MAG TPA: hypothetical protein [Caudoviricetes sp.]